MKKTKLAFRLAAALFLCSQALKLPAADSGQTNITVEVLIFSGRPNPTWQMQDTNRLQVLKAQLKDLPVAFEKEPVEWSRLGFAGFRIRGGEVMGLPGEIRIYQGVIKTGQGKETKYVKDSQGLERSLIAQAKKQALEQPVKDAITRYENDRKGAQ